MPDRVRVALALALLIAPLQAFAATAAVRIGDKTFTLPEGFTIELVAGPAAAGGKGAGLVDRPVTMDFDDVGRLYVTESSGTNDKAVKQLEDKPHRILRLEDTDGDGVFDKRTVFAEKLMFPEGTMWLAGSLYVAAPPQIWKITDADGDGVAEAREVWFDGKTLTGCANDLHGPYAGPDGRIYWCKGAFAKQTYTLPGGREFVTRASHIFRAKPGGTGIEPVMTGGMDNPVDVVFMPNGERIFSCTFLQQPANGRRDGLQHAVYGAVYGKVHDVLDGHPRTGPDVMPVLSHLGPAAACGLHRLESSAFGKDASGTPYRDNVFACSFNLHKVTRHVLAPQGATFASRDEDFVACDHVDFHPTDVIEDADGSLLIVDTGGWYKLCCPTSQFHKPDVLGAIYRVRRVGAAKVEDPRGAKIAWGSRSAEQLTALFDDARPAVRRRAVEELASRAFSRDPKGEPQASPKGSAPADVLGALTGAVSSPSALVRLNAVWAAARRDGPAARAIARAALDDKDETVRQAALHTISLHRDAGAMEKVADVLKSASDAQTRRVAAEALGRIGDARAVPALLAALDAPAKGPVAAPAPDASAPASDVFLDHSLIYALIEIGDPSCAAVAKRSYGPGALRGALVAADQMPGGSLRPELLEALLSADSGPARETAAWLAGRRPEYGDVFLKALRQRLAAANVSAAERAELRRRVDGLARLAGSPAVQAFLAERVTSAPDPAERQRAFRAMGQAQLRSLPESWERALGAAVSRGGPETAASAAAALRALSPKKDAAARLAPTILKAAERTDLSDPARLDLLITLTTRDPKDKGPKPALPPGLSTFVVALLDPKRPPTDRMAAADVVARLKWTDEQLVFLTGAVDEVGPLELARLLPAFEQTKDAAVGGHLVDALGKSKALTSLRADALQALLKRFPPAVQAKAEPLYAKLNPDGARQKAHLDELLASLPAGDVRRGQQVFNSSKAACSTCHAIGYVGGKAGPDLTRIGAIRQARDLLESIVYPSASFVQSFEPAIIETEDGDTVNGVLKATGDELVLITGPTQETRVPKAEVKSIRPGSLSIMPAGLEQQLAPQELADLVAFLGACK